MKAANITSRARALAGRTDALFPAMLGAIALAGLALRIAYVLIAKRDEPLAGDAVFYAQQGHAVADGLGFINPASYYYLGVLRPNADHPPLFTLLVAALDLLGIDTPLGQRLALAFIGVATIVVVGFIGRRLAGSRVGLLAAMLAAFAPGVWVNDGQVLSEGPGMLAVAVVVLIAIGLARSPSPRAALIFGAAAGVATLIRPEALILLPLIAIPVGIRMRSNARTALIVVGAAGIAFLVVISPWMVRNFTTFDHPVLISTNVDRALENTNCDLTYRGELLGWWSIDCVQGPGPRARIDETTLAIRARNRGLDYIGDHIDRVPLVVAARLGRAWGVFRPSQTAELMVAEGREKFIGLTDAVSLWVLVPLTVAGAVVLRRRRVQLAAMLAPLFVANISIVLAFGNPRYRTIAAVSLCVLPAVAVDAWMTRRSSRRPEAAARGVDPTVGPPLEDPEPSAV